MIRSVSRNSKGRKSKKLPEKEKNQKDQREIYGLENQNINIKRPKSKGYITQRSNTEAAAEYNNMNNPTPYYGRKTCITEKGDKIPILKQS